MTTTSATRNIKDEKSVYDIAIIKNNNQAYDEVVYVSNGTITNQMTSVRNE
jgi:hypothetical protein